MSERAPLINERVEKASRTSKPPLHSRSVAPQIDSLSSLQRTLGNQGVQRLLEGSGVGPGKPLDSVVRSIMEGPFGQDFSGVRVHTDFSANRAAETVDALAYTVGQDVVFARDQYDPGTARGRYILAHELSHTLQQRNADERSVAVPEQPAVEHEAERAARSVATGGVASVPSRIGSRSLQRLALVPEEFTKTDIPDPVAARKSPDYVDNGIDEVQLLPEPGGIGSVLNPRFIAITIRYTDGSMLIVPLEHLQAPREPTATQIIRFRKHTQTGKIFPLIWRGTVEQMVEEYELSKGIIAFNRDVTPMIMALYDRAIVRVAFVYSKLAAALWSVGLGARGVIQFFSAAQLLALQAGQQAAAGRMAREEGIQQAREQMTEAERRATAEAERKAARAAGREAQQEAERKAAQEAYQRRTQERAAQTAERETEQEARRRAQQEAQRRAAPEARRRAEREAQWEAEQEPQREAGREAARAERAAQGLGPFLRLVGKRVREVFGEIRFGGLKRNRPLSGLSDAEIRDAFSKSPFRPTNHVIMRLRDPRTANLGVATLDDLASNLNSSLIEDSGEGLLRLVAPDRRLYMLIDPRTNTLVTFRPFG
jgi:hypothetical protein